MDWFLYDNGLRHERVKLLLHWIFSWNISNAISFLQMRFVFQKSLSIKIPCSEFLPIWFQNRKIRIYETPDTDLLPYPNHVGTYPFKDIKSHSITSVRVSVSFLYPTLKSLKNLWPSNFSERGIFVWNGLLTCFFIRSNNFISNARLKMAKNQANAKQQHEAELLLFENYSHSSFTLSSKNNRT